jgi:CheY-like chemotaxis protein/anti-sigma regulatory factor (Ser/Thr protein kinase)
MQMLLEQAEFRTSVAKDGLEAMQMVRVNQPDLVVTDLHMPNKNGLELVEEVNKEFPSTPVVLTTAKGSEEIAAEALRKGAASYVPKKNLKLDLITTVKRILAVVHSHDTNQQLANLLLAKQVEFSLTNDDKIVPHVIAQLEDLVSQMGLCSQNELVQIATALDEALLNAIIHGNLEVSSKHREVDNGRPYMELINQRREQSPYRDRRVFLSAKMTRYDATFVIRDEGPGFDPNSIPDPTDPANLENVSGRGLLLINAFMDEVRHSEKGNEITLLKRKKQ